MFIRVSATGGSEFPLDVSGAGWIDGGDGYWYYNTSIGPGEETAPLDVKINNVPSSGLPDDFSFDVTVKYQGSAGCRG
jgi:hypothetical protein